MTPWNGQKWPKFDKQQLSHDEDKFFPRSDHISQLNKNKYKNLMRNFFLKM